MTYKEIRKNKEIKAFIKRAGINLTSLGFTDHSEVHTTLVADRAAAILKEFGYDEHTIELAKIAGYMHDIGNAVNRTHHAEYGAILANDILKDTDMPLEDRVTIVSCIDKAPALNIKRVIISCDNFFTICYKVNKLNSYKKRNDGTFQKNI